jgi:hypothetical protein
MVGIPRRLMRCGIAAALGALVLAPLNAAQASTTNSDTYSKSWTFVSDPLGACITVKVSGTINYSTSITTTGSGKVSITTYNVINIKLTSPKLTATVSPYTPSYGCYTTSATLYKLSMGQHWSGYSCSWNPSISVSAPWGFSVGGWPSCGTRSQATYSTSYGSGSTYTQNNTGSPATFPNKSVGGALPPSVCYGVYVNVTAYYNSSTSDSFSAADGQSAKEVCLTPVN